MHICASVVHLTAHKGNKMLIQVGFRSRPRKTVKPTAAWRRAAATLARANRAPNAGKEHGRHIAIKIALFEVVKVDGCASTGNSSVSFNTGSWHLAHGTRRPTCKWRLVCLAPAGSLQFGGRCNWPQRDNGLGSAHVANKQTLNELARPQGHDSKARTFCGTRRARLCPLPLLAEHL